MQTSGETAFTKSFFKRVFGVADSLNSYYHCLELERWLGKVARLGHEIRRISLVPKLKRKAIKIGQKRHPGPRRADGSAVLPFVATVEPKRAPRDLLLPASPGSDVRLNLHSPESIPSRSKSQTPRDRAPNHSRRSRVDLPLPSVQIRRPPSQKHCPDPSINRRATTPPSRQHPPLFARPIHPLHLLDRRRIRPGAEHVTSTTNEGEPPPARFSSHPRPPSESQTRSWPVVTVATCSASARSC